jgi:hypothetical protein
MNPFNGTTLARHLSGIAAPTLEETALLRGSDTNQFAERRRGLERAFARRVVDPARLRRFPGGGDEGVRALAERSARENWITRDRAEISAAEAETDRIVYGPFG